MSMEIFLKTTKILSEDLKAFDKVCVVLGNETADLDSSVSAIVYAFHLYKTSFCENKSQIVLPVINVKQEEFHLRTEVVYVCRRFGVDYKNFVFVNEVNLQDLHAAKHLQLVLIDHNMLAQHQLGLQPAITEIIDHHKDTSQISAGCKKTIELVGSCATLIAEHLIATQSPALNTLTAGLLMTTVLLDTINLETQAGRTTKKDEKIIHELKKHCEQGLSTNELYRAVTEAKFDVTTLSNTDLLRKDYKLVPQGQKRLRICVSSISLSLQDFFLRENTHYDIEVFCLSMNLDVLVLMPIFFEAESEIPRRQIGVCGPNVNALEEVAAYLSNSSELRLTVITVGQLPHLKAYDQENATASRKVVLPLLMTFLSR